MEALRAHKPDILALLTETEYLSRILPADMAAWPDEAWDWYEERAGIQQYDAGLPRNLAEQKAEAITREAFKEGWIGA